MTVIIGVDPHKATHTAVAICRDERELTSITVSATKNQVTKLLSWAEPLGPRTWAIESAGGLGYLLAQQLVEAGEDVVDVPATLGLAHPRARDPPLEQERPERRALGRDRRAASTGAAIGEAGRPLRGAPAARQAQQGPRQPSHQGRLSAPRAARRPHAGRDLQGDERLGRRRLLDRFDPATPVEQTRYELALELLEDVRRLDAQLKESHRRITIAVKASGTSLTDLYGIGPIIASEIVGYAGDVRRFAGRDAFAAYNGTAPIELSSGGRVVHRVSRRGNRQLNHAIHMAAICQIRQTGSDGRAYFERKVAEGKTKKEAIRSLKRHVSNAVYRQLLIDAERSKK